MKVKKHGPGNPQPNPIAGLVKKQIVVDGQKVTIYRKRGELSKLEKLAGNASSRRRQDRKIEAVRKAVEAELPKLSLTFTEGRNTAEIRMIKGFEIVFRPYSKITLKGPEMWKGHVHANLMVGRRGIPLGWFEKEFGLITEI